MNTKTIFILSAIAGAAFYLYQSKNKKVVNARGKAVKILNKVGREVKMIATNISNYGVKLIKELETLQLKAYPDAGGFSIGYGHFMGLKPKYSLINEAQADEFFKTDVSNVESEMRKYIKVPLNQNQHDALVSFFYNVGHKGFINKNGSQTHILQKLNASDYVGAANELDRWAFSKGVKNTALENRRAREKALFLA